MSPENVKQSPEGDVGGAAGGGVERGVGGRALPRLFGEMTESDLSRAVDSDAGVVGGREAAGDEGGAPREELWDSPVESSEEVDREEGVAVDAGAAAEEGEVEEHEFDEEYETPALSGRRKGSAKRKLREFEVKLGPAQVGLTAEQRMLVLDTWMRSKLPARKVSELMGLSPHTLYAWKRRFEELGPAGLDEKRDGEPTARGDAAGDRDDEAAAPGVGVRPAPRHAPPQCWVRGEFGGDPSGVA